LREEPALSEVEGTRTAYMLPAKAHRSFGPQKKRPSGCQL